MVRPAAGWRAEVATSFEPCRLVAASVAPARTAVQVDDVDPGWTRAATSTRRGRTPGTGRADGGEVLDVLARTAARLPVVSLTLASHDPAHDPAGRLRATALDLLEQVAARATPVTPAR